MVRLSPCISGGITWCKTITYCLNGILILSVVYLLFLSSIENIILGYTNFYQYVAQVQRQNQTVSGGSSTKIQTNNITVLGVSMAKKTKLTPSKRKSAVTKRKVRVRNVPKAGTSRTLKGSSFTSHQLVNHSVHPVATRPETTLAAAEAEVSGLCPSTPPGLEGIWTPRIDIIDWPTQEAKHPDVAVGGRWRPKDCISQHRVAVLIPYRNRSEHLHIFMNNMHDFFQRQWLDYGIYIIEQAGLALFNRAILLNIGFKEALKDHNWGCVVLHDIDHIPLNDHNLYTCSKSPRHLAVAVAKFNFRMPYSTYFGGVSIMTAEHYQMVNGMSNRYWGWGGEDDDLYCRCVNKGLVPIQRYSAKIGAYKSVQLYHKRAPVNPSRITLLNKATKRQSSDGLSDLKYEVQKKDYKKLYTYILVNPGRMARR